MTFICPTCEKDCRPPGTNVIGMEIQEYDKAIGWLSTKDVYETNCKATIAMNLIKEDGIIRRVYSVFEDRKFGIFKD